MYVKQFHQFYLIWKTFYLRDEDIESDLTMLPQVVSSCSFMLHFFKLPHIKGLQKKQFMHRPLILTETYSRFKSKTTFSKCHRYPSSSMLNSFLTSASEADISFTLLMRPGNHEKKAQQCFLCNFHQFEALPVGFFCLKTWMLV